MTILNEYLNYIQETKDEKDKTWWEKYWKVRQTQGATNNNLSCVKRLREKYKIFEYEKRKVPVPENIMYRFKQEASKLCHTYL